MLIKPYSFNINNDHLNTGLILTCQSQIKFIFTIINYKTGVKMGMEIFPNCFCNLVTDTTMTVILYHLLPRKSKFLTKQLYLRESDFPQTPPCPSCELAVQGPQRWAARKAGSTPTAGGARGMWLPLPLGSQQHKQAGPADKSEVTQTKDIKRFENSNNQTISST